MMESKYGKWGALLVEGLQEALAYERGEGQAGRVHTRELAERTVHAEPPPWYSGSQVREIRSKLALPQPLFAEMLNVSLRTLRAWEQGKREPDGPARRLLEIADTRPEILMGSLRQAIVRTSGVRSVARAADGPRAAAETQPREQT